MPLVLAFTADALFLETLAGRSCFIATSPPVGSLSPVSGKTAGPLPDPGTCRSRYIKKATLFQENTSRRSRRPPPVSDRTKLPVSPCVDTFAPFGLLGGLPRWGLCPASRFGYPEGIENGADREAGRHVEPGEFDLSACRNTGRARTIIKGKARCLWERRVRTLQPCMTD